MSKELLLLQNIVEIEDSYIESRKTLRVLLKRMEILELLRSGYLNVQFYKQDNTVRDMVCTLRYDLLPKMDVMEEKYKPEENILDPNWDVDLIKIYEKDVGWRSFKISRIINFTMESK